MKNFRTLLAELAENSPKEVTFTFGRFQGLTVGHEKLLDSIFKQPGDHYVFISQSVGDEKNPLSPEAKKKLLISAYPENKKAFSIEFRTPFEALGFLVDKGYSRIKMIVGEDRVDTFKQSFSGNTFPVEVKSAGDRSESGNKVEQSAGNILRDLARAGQLKEFQAAAMTKLSADQKIDMFNQIRKAHGKAPVKVSVAEKIREDYVSGKIFNIGDIVTEGSNSFKIIDRGSNYVRVTNVEGKVSRKWLTDIQTKRTVDKTFAEAYKPLDESSFSCNGYTPVFPNKAPVAAFRASAGHCDQYALLEAIKATETMYASKDLKSLYESYNRSGDFLAKLGDIESHTYRKEFQNLIAKRLLENISSVSEVFAHDKEKIANFFADVVGVNKNLTVESTIQRCVNKINNTQLSESQKKIYVELIDCLIAEGFEFDFYNLNFIRECSVTEGSDRDLLIYADSIIESLTFEDLVSDYSEENFVILKEAFGKKSVKIEEPLSDKKIQQRAKQIALQYMKQRKSRKAVDRLTTAERKKIEEIVNKKGSVLTMISKKLGKKIKKIESERLLPKEEPEIVKAEKQIPEDAFHGSPHRFEPDPDYPLGKFSLDKIGSGEGHQAYGHGLYFASTKDVADHYRKALSKAHWTYNGVKISEIKTLNDYAAEFVDDSVVQDKSKEGYFAPFVLGFVKKSNKITEIQKNAAIKFIDSAISKLQNTIEAGYNNAPSSVANSLKAKDLKVLEKCKRFRDYIQKNVDPKKFKHHGGFLYHVEIPEEEDYLLWDVTLSKHPEKIKNALVDLDILKNYVADINAKREEMNKLNPKRLDHPLLGDIARRVKTVDSLKGQEIYDHLSSKLGNPEKASNLLHSLGILGIKYFGERSYNYVVFDDKSINIKKVEG